MYLITGCQVPPSAGSPANGCDTVTAGSVAPAEPETNSGISSITSRYHSITNSPMVLLVVVVIRPAFMVATAFPEVPASDNPKSAQAVYVGITTTLLVYLKKDK